MLTPFLDAILLPKEYYMSMPVRKHTYWHCAFAVGALDVCYPMVIENFRALFVEKSAGALLLNALIVVACALAVGVVDTLVFCKPLADFLSRMPGIASEKVPGAAGDVPGAAGDEPGAAGDEPVTTGDKPATAAGDEPATVAGNGSATDSNEPDTAGDKPATAGGEPDAAGDKPGAAAPAASANAPAVIKPVAASDAHGSLFIRTVKVYALSALIVMPLAIAVQEAYRVFFYETSNGAQVNAIVATLAAMQIWAFAIMSRGMCSILRCAKGVQRAFVFFVVASWSILWGVTFSWLVFENAVVMDALMRLLL